MTQGWHSYPGSRRHIILTGVVLASIGASSIALGWISVDNRLEQWVGATARDTYEAFRARYGSDELIFAAYSGAPIFSESALACQATVLEQLERIDGVIRVLGVPAVARELGALDNPAGVEFELTNTPFYKNLIVSTDSTVAGFVIETDASGDASARERMVAAISDAMTPLRNRGFEVHLAGPPVLNVALDKYASRETARTLPVALFLGGIALMIVLRSARALVYVAISTLVSVSGAMGAMAWSGYSLNMVTSALPALLSVLSSASLVHLVSRCRAHIEAGLGYRAAVGAALAETARPMAIAHITTAAGFMSLLTAPMAPVRTLGLFASVGLLAGLAVNLTLAPAMLSRWGILPVKRGPNRPRLSKAGAVLRHPAAVVTLFAALAIPLGLGILRIRVESDPLRYLPPDSNVVHDYAFVGNQLTGFYTLEVDLRLGKDWLREDSLQIVDELERHLAEIPGVARVVSPVQFLKKLNADANPGAPGSYECPRPDQMRLLLSHSAGTADTFTSSCVSDDGRAVRLSLLVNQMSSNDFVRIRERVDEAIATLPSSCTATTTGIVSRLVDAQLSLTRAQVRGFAVAFGLVSLLLFVGLRSWRRALVAAPPNLFPILTALGLMGWLRIPLDAATVMIAGVALGIAVDDTVHYLEAFRRSSEAAPSRPDACRMAWRATVPAMAATTAMAFAGFFALTRSAFVPLAYFGLLTGVAMAGALISDLLLLPALLCVTRKESGHGRPS